MSEPNRISHRHPQPREDKEENLTPEAATVQQQDAQRESKTSDIRPEQTRRVELTARQRPHRPNDPIEDLRHLEAAQWDNVAVQNFTPSPSLLTEPSSSPATLAEGRYRRRFPRTLLLLASLLALVLSLVAVEGIQVVQRSEAALPGAGWIVAGLFLTAFALVAWAIAAAVLDYCRVRGNLCTPPVAISSLQHDSGIDWTTLCAVRRQLESEWGALGARLNSVLLQQLQAMRAELRNWPVDNTRQWLLRYDAELLAIIDEAVAECIRKETGSIALLTTLSPRGGLDSLLVIWRQFRLIRSVAILYGWRPGFLGTMVLVREVFTNAALAAGIDELGDVAAEMLGSSLSVYAGRLSGEALGNMALTLRLARRTVDACRPLRNRSAAPYRVTFSQFAGRIPHLFKLLWHGKETSA